MCRQSEGLFCSARAQRSASQSQHATCTHAAAHNLRLLSISVISAVRSALHAGLWQFPRALVSIWIARITSGANVDGESTLLARSRAHARSASAIGILALSRSNYFRSWVWVWTQRCREVGWGWALEFIDCRGALSVSFPFIWKQLRYKSRPFLPKWTRCALNSVHISRTSSSEFHIFVKSLD